MTKNFLRQNQKHLKSLPLVGPHFINHHVIKRPNPWHHHRKYLRPDFVFIVVPRGEWAESRM